MLSEWAQSLSQIAAGALLASIWQGALLAGMIWVCLKLAPKTTAGVRFLVWMAVFAAIVLLPLLSIPSGHPAQVIPGAQSGSALFQADFRWALAIAAAWILCSAFRASALIRNGLRLRSLWHRAVPIEVPPLQPLLKGSGVARAATLCVSADVDQPCVIGFFSPRILIPDWLPGKATESELQQIVLHELAHLRRLDDWTNLLQKLALICFPLHPALFWIEKRLCAEREGACDESVVRATNLPHEYATCLTNLAGERLERRMGGGAALSLGAWERRSELAGRVHRILSGQRQLSPMKLRAVTAALVLATAGGAVGLGGSPQVIQFTSAREFHAERGRRVATPVTGRYQDVVFHEPATPGKVIFRASDPAGPVVSTPVSGNFKSHANPKSGLRKIPTANAAEIPTLQRVDSPADNLQSLTIVTRWDGWDPSSGRHVVVTRVEQLVGNSAANASIQQQSGWYFAEL